MFRKKLTNLCASRAHVIPNTQMGLKQKNFVSRRFVETQRQTSCHSHAAIEASLGRDLRGGEAQFTENLANFFLPRILFGPLRPKRTMELESGVDRNEWEKIPLFFVKKTTAHKFKPFLHVNQESKCRQGCSLHSHDKWSIIQLKLDACRRLPPRELP